MTNTEVAQIRASLDHPVVDADGHVVESFPVVLDYMRRIAGADVADRFAGSSPTYLSRSAPLLERADEAPAFRFGIPQMAWWALPTNARDRATGFLPRLLHERLDEIGIDYADPLLERRARLHRPPGRRGAHGRVPRAEHVPRRAPRRPRRPAHGRRGDPHQHTRRGNRRARPRGARARVQDRDVQQPGAAPGSGARHRARSGTTRSRSTARTTTTRSGNGAWISASRSPRIRARRAWDCARRRRATCTTTSATSRRARTRSPSRCSSAASPDASPTSTSRSSSAASRGACSCCAISSTAGTSAAAPTSNASTRASSTPTSGTRS